MDKQYLILMQKCKSFSEFKLQMDIIDPGNDLKQYENDYAKEWQKFMNFVPKSESEPFTFENWFKIFKPKNLPVIVKFESDYTDPSTYAEAIRMTYIGKTSLKERMFDLNLEIFESLYQLQGIDMKEEILNVFKFEYERS